MGPHEPTTPPATTEAALSTQPTSTPIPRTPESTSSPITKNLFFCFLLFLLFFFFFDLFFFCFLFLFSFSFLLARCFIGTSSTPRNAYSRPHWGLHSTSNKPKQR